ncbi:MAG: hypothetical protein EBW47_08880 [Betaproteobacteria bacterium]|nr:hypothetical protein [Betaproteobacteria bacterium]
MRLVEIASAEEQIALFKLITDKVWQSLADQQRQADEQAAQQRRAQAMNGGRAKRAPTPKPIKPLKPIKPQPLTPPPKPKPIANPQSTQPMSFTNDKEPKQQSSMADAALDDARI